MLRKRRPDVTLCNVAAQSGLRSAYRRTDTALNCTSSALLVAWKVLHPALDVLNNALALRFRSVRACICVSGAFRQHQTARSLRAKSCTKAAQSSNSTKLFSQRKTVLQFRYTNLMEFLMFAGKDTVTLKQLAKALWRTDSNTKRDLPRLLAGIGIPESTSEDWKVYSKTATLRAVVVEWKIPADVATDIVLSLDIPQLLRSRRELLSQSDRNVEVLRAIKEELVSSRNTSGLLAQENYELKDQLKRLTVEVADLRSQKNILHTISLCYQQDLANAEQNLEDAKNRLPKRLR